jgi:peptidyl-prolyl isomerase E (cyclophilin E)
MTSLLVTAYSKGTNPKTTLYVGGLDEGITDATLHAAFIPFGDVKEVSIPIDHATGKNRGFGFVEYEEKEDALDAIDNMQNAELYGKVLKVNFAQPMKIKGGDKGWAHQPVWADADKYMDEVDAEKEAEDLSKEDSAAAVPAGTAADVDNPMAAMEAAIQP